MLVSVVMSTYNRTEKLMGRSLPSVLRQTHADLDIIVVGDGTEEATGAAIEALGDPRVRFWNLPRMVYPEDPGQRWCVLGLEARNFGLDQARGEWLTTLDDDDEYTDDHVSVLLAAISENVDFVYGRSKVTWPGGGEGHYGSWPPGHFQFCDGAALWRSSLPYRYDPECIARGLPEDGDLWDRMVAGGVRFAFVDQVVHLYYPNPR